MGKQYINTDDPNPGGTRDIDASDVRTMRARARGEALEHGGTIPASAHGLAIATNGVRGVPVRGLIVFSFASLAVS